MKRAKIEDTGLQVSVGFFCLSVYSSICPRSQVCDADEIRIRSSQFYKTVHIERSDQWWSV